MNVVIVGGGKVGFNLAKTLYEREHHVTVIELDRELCEYVAENLEIDVINGDGTDFSILEAANIKDTDVIVATTGKDEENLVICQIAKINFEVKKTIARVNNPKNRKVFKALGVDKTVCSTEVIANLLESEFAYDKLSTILALDRGEMIFLQTKVNRKTKWSGKKVSDLKVPEECLLISIIRNDQIIFPRGNTEILEEDEVIILTKASKRYEVEESLFGR